MSPVCSIAREVGGSNPLTPTKLSFAQFWFLLHYASGRHRVQQERNLESQTIVQLSSGIFAVLCVVIIIMRRNAKKKKEESDSF